MERQADKFHRVKFTTSRTRSESPHSDTPPSVSQGLISPAEPQSFMQGYTGLKKVVKKGTRLRL